MYPIHLTEYLDDLTIRAPSRTVLIDANATMTVVELRKRCLTTAVAIARRPVNATSIIAVYLPKSIDTVVADIGIIYSCNAYMNLDIRQPAQRTRNILALTRPALLLTTRALAGAVAELPECPPLLFLEDIPASHSLTREKEDELLTARANAIDADIMCIINTSGSTGTPKAVALTHRNFIDFTENSRAAGIWQGGEIVGSLSPQIFDIWSFELCMLMAGGSTLVLLPENAASFPARLLQNMATQHVSFIFWVPTIMVNIANMDLLSSIPLPDLRTVWFAGEVFPTAKCNYWRAKLPQATFVNMYGPIEITLDCCYHVLRRDFDDDEPIPIGKPFRNTSVLVLNDQGMPVRNGEEGELCIRGASLAQGYYNDPEKTAAAFTSSPLHTNYPERIYHTGDIVAANTDGELVFRGRKDTLIKHHGYRIELAEIEHVCIAQGHVKNCCAAYDKARQRIVLFYEADGTVEEADVRRSLRDILPRWMLPSDYRRLNFLPLNSNGKIDRCALKASLEERHNA